MGYNKWYFLLAYNRNAIFGYTNDVTYTAPASSSAYPTISYTLPDTPADQKDIIVAYSKDITKPSDNTLNLTFQHILTRINFAAKLADSNYTYTVESITITGAKVVRNVHIRRN